MRIKLTIAAVVAVLAGALFVATAGSAGAQGVVITPGPIETVPGIPGCAGNNNQQNVTSDITCANQRTFAIGPVSRTIRAVSTMRVDGSASTTFTVLGGNALLDVPLKICSHMGKSSGPLTTCVDGTIPQGTAGPVTLDYVFSCGQVDVKAIFTAGGDTRGRISGGFFCKVAPVETTTTAPTTTVAGATTTPTSAGTATVVTVAPGRIPDTGPGFPVLGAVIVALLLVAGGGAAGTLLGKD